ncbi:hypothetical protein [Massilia alkalitolerans]|uniref:hypothetical protein n=1 Tax=Massilia alkalitolerans TaxID=286638 RepID=UPI0028AE9D02|nr:hypothetical protein [Massilia alkalitolerans]
MKIICVTGAPGSDVNQVADIFFAAGAQPAQALRQDPALTLSSWHEKVLTASGIKAVPGPIHQPGRFWEQLATNLFMENMHRALWAWADVRGVWMLDFWQQFEPNLHFVLVYTSPQRALAEALAAEREHGADTASLMAAWEAHQKEILRFHHRNPQRTILVDAAECIAAPDTLLDACKARWDLPLAAEPAQLRAAPAAAPLVGYLAEQLRLTHPELQVLQQELEASLHALAPSRTAGSEAPDLMAAVDDYRQVSSAAARADALAAQLETLSGQLSDLDSELGKVRESEAAQRAKLRSDYDAAVQRAEQLETELAQATNSARTLAGEKSEYERSIAVLRESLAAQQAEVTALRARLDQQETERQAEVAALKAANAEAHSESEQILLQMHQLQEEMERWYLENKQHVDVRAAKKRQIEELNKKAAQYEASIATLKKELDAAKANKAAEKEKADALAALATARRELDAARQSIKRLEDEQRALVTRAGQQQAALDAANAKLDAALKDAASIKTKLDTAAKETATLKSSLEAANKAAAGAKADAEAGKRSAKEAQQENELLLVQLHQVQEELEHYFLEHKSALKQNAEFQQRWQRMLERNPDYCDYRALELLGNDKDSGRTRWRFTELDAAGRAFPELRFDIVVTKGVAAFAFARDGQAPGTPDPLEALGTADWLLLPTLCRVLDDALQAPSASVAQLDDAQRTALREALAALLDLIRRMPAVLRFDRIALKREQVNPDYEHLWLQLGNLSLGDKRWSEFEFRLSCANVRPGKFGAHPKLEFPSDAGAVLFDSWFAESYDDFGEKLELRFALPDAMDVSVWDQLSQADRDMMTRLVALLPRMLERLEALTPTLARPYADWQQLAKSVQAIVARRIAAALRAAAPAAAPIALQQPAGKPKKADGIQKGTI